MLFLSASPPPPNGLPYQECAAVTSVGAHFSEEIDGQMKKATKSTIGNKNTPVRHSYWVEFSKILSTSIQNDQ